MINSETKIYGIIGYPIKHSLSPKLHSELFKSYSINAVYVAFETNNAENAVKGIAALNIRGVNVTVPHKEKVIKFIDEIDKDAKKLGAVNVIKNIDGKLTGYNTDYLGFMYMFKNNIKNIDSLDKITVLGAGGAAKSIIYALHKMGFKSIFLLNRTKEKAEEIRKFFKNIINIYTSHLSDKNILASSDVIINCTSVGLNEKKSPIDINYVDKPIIMDIIYKDSLLIKQARSKKLKAVNGMDMFISQAIFTFEIFTGIKTDIKMAYNIIKKGEIS